jgi:vanillate O-demethylase monooxygenase subunit
VAPFLSNQWYTAATSAELGAKPLARTICNEPLVIFRAQDGAVAVLTDRCPTARRSSRGHGRARRLLKRLANRPSASDGPAVGIPTSERR